MHLLWLILLIPALAAQVELQHPEGLEVAEFAAHPQMANPVAIEVAMDGRVFVAEQYRFNRGTEENRSSGFLLEDDLQIQTLDDRLAMYRKWAHRYDGGFDWYSRYSDQIRLLRDTNEDGRADSSQIFASFNEPLDGLAAGVLPIGDEVWVTCLPNLLRFRDADRDGIPESREIMQTGFGVRASYLGHDLHGLVIGPDNRLYFSLGDRGFHITLPDGKVLHGPDEGAVFRCKRDGSQLELIHRGLRNPQEIAFDEWGNLFADDNNCDKGDRSRLVYIIDGGNSGWRMHYQTLPNPYLTGPWKQEDIWMMESDRAPLWHTRPAGYLGRGPSGMTYSAVGAWPGELRNRFFYCNYTGRGGIETFRVEPAGADFRIIEHQDFLKPLRISDCAFGYDGRLYATGYVGNPWRHDISGRIITIHDPHLHPGASALRVLALADFATLGTGRLISLLKHPDQRIRLRAQNTLAHKGAAAEFARLAANRDAPRLQRVHAIWGIWQMGIEGGSTAQLFVLANDPDPEIRAQALRVLGDLRKAAPFVRSLNDGSLRVRYFAVRGIGRGGMGLLAPKLLDLADETDDHILQQAIVIALARSARESTILPLIGHHSAKRRLVALLVLRQWKHPALARFLADTDDSLALEAARAIHDLPIADSANALADSGQRADTMPERLRLPMFRRVIAANRALADANSAERLLDIALNSADEQIQDLALAALATWDRNLKRDLVTGEWRPLPPADPVSSPTLSRFATRLLGSDNLAKTLPACRSLGLHPNPQDLQRMLADEATPATALPQLFALLAESAADQALALAPDLIARRQAVPAVLSFLESAQPDAAKPLLEALANDAGTATALRQRAIRGLVAARSTEGLSALLAQPPPQLVLELREAGLQTEDSGELAGGDHQRGHDLFLNHPAAQCIRCHKVGGEGGDSGPDLSIIGATLTRDQLLESLLEPNARIAPGFELAAEQPISAMPPMGSVLTAYERRDLIAYLASLTK